MKYIISTLLLCISLASASAQEVYLSSGRPDHAQKHKTQKEGFDPSKLIFGGGLGLSIGSGLTYFAISPLVGYRFTDKLSAGVEFGYQYYHNQNDVVETPGGLAPFDRKSTIYTTGFWGRYLVWKNIFIQSRFEMLNVDNYQNFRWDTYGTTIIADDTRQWVPALILGAGIRQRISENSSLILYLGYDVIQDVNSPYYKTLDMGVAFNVGF
jgi:hypothetical protein